MKKICLMRLSTAAFAQSPTTQEEYNYATKGYKIQLESGLDTKKGYIIKDAFIYGGSPNYSFTFKYLIREGNNELACILIIAKSITWGNVYYLCLPNQLDNPLYIEFLKSISIWDKPMLLEYQKAFTVLTFPGVQHIYKN